MPCAGSRRRNAASGCAGCSAERAGVPVADRVHAVIGAGYGDEGKGRTVDALAHALGPGAVVVRTNGGAQAGHTVVLPGGARHVFHHLGSGALAGAGTHLSRFMVSHPMTLGGELRAVAALGGAVAVTADPRGFVTTPWDMMVNQAAEAARGGARHGSCGLGFGETVGRCEGTPFPLSVADLFTADLRDRLLAIRGQWLPARVQALGDAAAGSEFLALAGSDAVLDRFMLDCREFARLVRPRDDAELGSARHLVFEAAQGLLLDQRHRNFPFVTRSNTGIRNMVALAEAAGVRRMDAHYVTRCYLTRHGRGPLPGERGLGGLFDIDDPTNGPNPWQEAIRTGLLDPAELAAAIGADLRDAGGRQVAVQPHLSVTCLDQARDGTVAHLDAGAMVRTGATAFAQMLRDRVGAVTVAAWRGPSRPCARH